MDNQEQQPLPQPDQTPPQAHPESGKKKYLVIGIIALVALLLLAVASVLLVNRFDKNGDGLGGLLSPGFTDWLKPSKEINVGTHRYVSPCQVLPQDEVTKLYGNFSAGGYIMEDYLDQSPPEKVRSVRAFCTYELNNKENARVELNTTQYRDPQEMKRLSSVMGLVDVEDAEKALAEFKQLVGNSENKDARELIERFNASVATYKKYDKVFDTKALADLKTDGLLVPSDRDITLLQDNVAYVFSYEPAPVTERPSNDQLIGYVARLNKTIEIIEKNAKDPALSQSPARTVIGTSDTVGSTKLLESCAVLTPSLFRSVTGRDQNDAVHRISAVYDPNTDRFAKADKSLLLPYSTCERDYNRHNDATAAPTTQNVSMELEIQHAKTEQAAKDYLAKYFPEKDGNVTLQTRADWAQQRTREDLLDASQTTNFYSFRVGPYIATVDIRMVMSEGLQSDIIQSEGTPEQHIQAINELVDSLRAHLKKVNE